VPAANVIFVGPITAGDALYAPPVVPAPVSQLTCVVSPVLLYTLIWYVIVPVPTGGVQAKVTEFVVEVVILNAVGGPGATAAEAVAPWAVTPSEVTLFLTDTIL